MSKKGRVKVEDKDKEMWIGKTRMYFGGDNTIYVTAVGEVDGNIATKQRDATIEILNMAEGTVNIIVDLTRSGKLSPEARKVFRELTENEKIGKLALFGMHPVARVIASFFMGATKKKDIRFFNSKEEALAWLKE